MVRMIDADALLPMMKYATTDNEIGVFPIKIGFNTIAKVIDDAPTIDAVPVKHGKWIIRDNPGTGWYRVTCSECGEDVTSTAPCIGFFPNAKVTWDYCPSCGARMDEERKEE